MRGARLFPPALACAIVLSGCGGWTKSGGRAVHDTVLTIATKGGSDEVAEYAAAVQRLSGGSIRLVPEENWRSGDPDPARGTIADVRAGRIDLAKIDVRSYKRLGVVGFDAVIAPFLVDRLTLEEKLLASSLPWRMLATLARLGVDGIAMLPGPLEHPFGLERRLLSPSGYRGAVIGTTPTPLARLSLGALHAVPRAYRPAELPVAVYGRRTRPRQPRGRRALPRLREVFGHRERRVLARSSHDHREPRGSGAVDGRRPQTSRTRPKNRSARPWRSFRRRIVRQFRLFVSATELRLSKRRRRMSPRCGLRFVPSTRGSSEIR